MINQRVCRRVIFFAFLSSVPVMRGVSQLNVAIQMDPNPSPYISDWRSNPNTIRLIVTNSGRVTHSVRLDAFIEGSERGRVAETRLDAAVPPLAVPPGSAVITAVDAHVLEEGAVRYLGPTRNETAASGRLPEDQYKLCVTLVAYDAPHAALSPRICAQIRIALLQPADLLQPPANSSTRPPPSFQWSVVPLGTGKFARYELVVKELDPGQSNVSAAFRTNAPLFTRETNLPVYQHMPSDPPLQPGHRYAWSVRSFDADDRFVFVNNGSSRIWTFTYGAGELSVVPRVHRPDTLIAGTFKIIVESWDSTTKSISKSLPSGAGYVKFSCGPRLFQRIKPIGADIGQFNLKDGAMLESDPLFEKRKADSAALKSAVKNPAQQYQVKPAPHPLPASGEGIRVAFRDVHWKGPAQSAVVLDEGIAVYPTVPASPPVPALIELDSAFTLAIDTLIITATDATVSGSILLPPSIIPDGQCASASIGLPPTSITSNCEFYRTVPDSSFGPYFVGGTDVIVQGKGYTVDFSSLMSPPGQAPPLSKSWKGIALLGGETPPAGEPVVSNRGYTKAHYTFLDALIGAGGLDATLKIKDPFLFKTLDPYGYEISLTGNSATDYLRIRNSAVAEGLFLKTHVALPDRAVRDTVGKAVMVECDSLFVQADMDMFARVSLTAGAGLTWGEFAKTPGDPADYQLVAGKDMPGQLYFAARFMSPFFPLNDTVYKAPVLALSDDGSTAEAERRQGVTLKGGPESSYTIWSKDIPDSTQPPRFQKNIPKNLWMNFVADGVHAEIILMWETDFSMNVGPPWKTGMSYEGGAAFELLFAGAQKEKKPPMMTRFISSAVWDSDWRGSIPFAFPIGDTIPFARLMFTSTADCAGGQLDLAKPADFDYWGLKLVAKDSTKSAGIICGKKGVVYLTASGFHEPVHFDVPFNLIWGELKANGNLGRLYFDYNNAGQKFDHFPYTQSFVALSDYVTGTDTGYVQTCGTVSIGYFGAKQMTIADYKCKNDSIPYRGRMVRLEDPLKSACPPADLRWERDWAGSLGALSFDMAYDSSAQEGFVGSGAVKLKPIGGSMASTIVVRADRSCICISDPGSISHSIMLGWDASFSSGVKVWGCGCIVGEKLENFVVGGELETSSTAESGLAARAGAIIAFKLMIRPAWYRFSASGDFFLSLGAGGGDVELSGSVDILQDNSKGVCAGALKGAVSFSTLIAGITGDGEFEWVLGEDVQSLQGRVAVNIYGTAGAGVESGVFVGIRAPKENAWVLDDMDGHFGVNKGGLPGKLTGFYAYLSTSASLNLAVISGGYKVYAGMGAFADFTGKTMVNGLGVLGNVGIHVWGEMLAGFASVEAWGNLQLLGGMPPAFSGSLGMEACVLWSICKNIEVGCGYNIIDGLYLD